MPSPEPTHPLDLPEAALPAGPDEGSLIWHGEQHERGNAAEERASGLGSGVRTMQSIANRAWRRIFGWTSGRSWRLRDPLDDDRLSEDDMRDPVPSADALVSGPAAPRGIVQISSIPIKGEGELLHRPTLAGNADELVDFAANTQAERALVRHVALAAAATTWCVLQPFILFFVIAHFKQYVHVLVLLAHRSAS